VKFNHFMTQSLNIKIDPDSSTPENEFDEWFSLTHPNGTKAVWEDIDDSDELDIDRLEYDED
jgi:hypothetical protein